METKSLLIGIISFIAGALLVSVAATTFEKDKLTNSNSADKPHMTENMDHMEGGDRHH